LSAKNWVKFIMLGLMWGSSFLWIKIALQEVNPFMLVFFRVLFASMGLVVYFIFLRRKLTLRWWWVYAFIGFFNVAFPFALISWAETHISSGLASILNSTVPLFTMIVASFFYKEDRITLVRGIGLAVGFFGVLILSYTRLEGNSEYQTLGIVAMLVAACAYGVSSVFARRVDKLVTADEHSFGQMLAGLIFIAPAMLITNSPLTLPHIPLTWVAFAWLGLIGSFISPVIWFAMIYDIGPSRTSMVTYMFPLVGVLLGIIFLNETMSWQIYIGGLLVLAGIYIVNSKRFSKLILAKATKPQPGSVNE
jgi:drug/metabolite transporter (DMT)-like permease